MPTGPIRLSSQHLQIFTEELAELLEAGLGGELTDSGKDYVGAILQSVERLGEQIESLS